MNPSLLQGFFGIARCGYACPYVYLVLSENRSLRFFGLGVGHADDAWNISARSVNCPSSTSSDRLAWRSSTAEDMQRRALVFPIRASPSGSCTVAGHKALAIRPQHLATRRQQLMAGYVQYGT